MHGNSPPVRSPQLAPHPRLVEALARRAGRAWLAPMPAHVANAAAAIAAEQARTGRDVLLDAGCGDGSSTRALARLHPELLCIGVDRSAVRLGSRAGVVHDDTLLLRTDAARLWAALRALGVRVAQHRLLYPNPWPKPAQRNRRWHCHPAFADLLALGGELEVRCNWRVYAEECVAALAHAGREAALDALPEAEPLTPFERKYRASGHALWRVTARL